MARAENPANHDSYLRAAQKLIDIGQSRGAHVYFVQHHRPNNSTEFNAAEIAERLQGIAAEGRGIGHLRHADVGIDRGERVRSSERTAARKCVVQR